MTQTLNCQPYVEPHINQRLSGYNERFTFTGKELDEETGYGYFGARYMDHELMTGWLSVDPMADKYPSLSPYNYCAWNPMKLVDLDGREWDPASEEIVSEYKEGLETKLTEISDEKQRKEIGDALKELVVLSESDQVYHVEIGEVKTPRSKGEIGWDAKNSRVSITLDFDYQISDIAHEMKHAYQFETGDLSFDSHTGRYGVLYDVTDERAAYDRSAALGGQIVNDATISRQRTKNGNGGCDYPFIMRDQAQWPDVGQERITNRNVNSKVSLINNVYRKNGKTIVR